ncbi:MULTISPECIES: HAMP domain-containing sensor histidine kinase [Haloferax]|uniref:histidine kinase n=1 Tax=Haloferax marinum TaxID=2666143 RepID=A0A6A8GA61_9EURY|nr:MULTISPECIES: HAMP domain-containing sensor histidine kinase [Haloferax]KAB1191210.1 HAMP domain-containing histidine kinase [Haloferax sp. CBA1150]MRW98100.1 sensor histidine kinase [Haloferax marinum]
MQLLLLLSHDRNQEVLSEKLTPYYDVSTSVELLDSGGFDLCIFDEDSLHTHRQQLVAHKHAEDPVFLPYLLVATRGADEIDTAVLELVDELIMAPILLEELGPRLKSLLRNRRLAQELSEREELEEMAAIISHDLRNPLNIARGNLELGRETKSDEYLQTTEDALKRMSSLIDDLLSFAKQEYSNLAPQPVSLRDVASRSWDLVETGDVTLDIGLPDDTVVMADASRVQKLFSNLYRNAYEHNGGQLTVTVGRLADGFFVADDGTGIPEEDRSTVFERGYTTNDDGTGFGLPIVKRVGTAHSWTVEVTESESGGAQFEFTGVEFLDEPADDGNE